METPDNKSDNTTETMNNLEKKRYNDDMVKVISLIDILITILFVMFFSIGYIVNTYIIQSNNKNLLIFLLFFILIKCVNQLFVGLFKTKQKHLIIYLYHLVFIIVIILIASFSYLKSESFKKESKNTNLFGFEIKAYEIIIIASAYTIGFSFLIFINILYERFISKKSYTIVVGNECQMANAMLKKYMNLYLNFLDLISFLLKISIFIHNNIFIVYRIQKIGLMSNIIDSVSMQLPTKSKFEIYSKSFIIDLNYVDAGKRPYTNITVNLEYFSEDSDNTKMINYWLILILTPFVIDVVKASFVLIGRKELICKLSYRSLAIFLLTINILTLINTYNAMNSYITVMGFYVYINFILFALSVIHGFLWTFGWLYATCILCYKNKIDDEILYILQSA